MFAGRCSEKGDNVLRAPLTYSAPIATSRSRLESVCGAAAARPSGPFVPASRGNRLRKFRRPCGRCARLVQACVEPGELAPFAVPRGEDVRRQVAHASAPGQLFSRANLCRADWRRDMGWLGAAGSAGIRVAAGLCAPPAPVGPLGIRHRSPGRCRPPGLPTGIAPSRRPRASPVGVSSRVFPSMGVLCGTPTLAHSSVGAPHVRPRVRGRPAASSRD